MMEPWEIIVLVIGLILLILGMWLWKLAVRIDSLHRRVIATRGSLGKALVKRASDSLLLARSGLLDEAAAAELLDAAQSSLEAVELPVVSDGIEDESTATDILEDSRYSIESRLSRVLREILDEEVRQRLEADPLGQVMLEDLDATAYRVQVTRTLHNQNVSLVRHLRSRLPARVFHLAGRAPVPQYVDLDDGD